MEESSTATANFCQSVFTMLSSCYGLEDQVPLTFNDSKDKGPKDKTHAFESRLMDLRFKRHQMLQEDENKVMQVSFSKKLDVISKKLMKPQENLDEIFESEKTAKPEIPIYIRNSQKYKQGENNERPSSPYKPMNMAEIQKTFQKRLKKSEEIGKARAGHRVSTMRKHAMSCNVPNPEGKISV